MHCKNIALAVSLIGLILSHKPSSAQTGSKFFDDSYIHTIEINSIPNHWPYQTFHDQLYDSHKAVFYLHNQTKTYFPASLKIDGVFLDSIGVRYKGNSSFQFAKSKFSLKLDLNEFVNKQSYDGQVKINLHNDLLDISTIRNKLSYEVLNRMGVPAPRVSYSHVYMNGYYLGIYSMVEQIDKRFVRSRFDPNQTGFLYKSWSWQIEPMDTSNTNWNRDWIQHKAGKKSKEDSVLKQFISDINTADSLGFDQHIHRFFDIDGFISQVAVNMVVGDMDHFYGNWYLYKDPRDSIWHRIPWDYDLAFNINRNAISYFANPTEFQFHFLYNQLLNSPTLKKQYYDKLCDVVNHGMDSTWLNERILALSNLLANALESDVQHPLYARDYNLYLDSSYGFTNANRFNQLSARDIVGIRTFANSRFEAVRHSLKSSAFPCSFAKGPSDNAIIYSVYPNPSSGLVHIEGQGIIERISIHNMLGQSFDPVLLDKISQNHYSIDLSSLPRGTYHLSLEEKGKHYYYPLILL